MVDLYTKAVLTVIAASLVLLAVQGSIPNAIAQLGRGCGSLPGEACYVQAPRGNPVEVVISR
jgi:hypothetical protein